MSEPRPLRWWEEDAYTGWRKVTIWRRGQLRRIKQMTHRLDRRKARQTDWRTDERP